VIDNLLSHAVRHTGAGGTVAVAVAQLNSTIELSVKDTGMGLSEHQLARLFIPFDRLGAERTKVAGTGLGLALFEGVETDAQLMLPRARGCDEYQRYLFGRSCPSDPFAALLRKHQTLEPAAPSSPL